MVVEIAVFTAKDGHADQFAAAYAQARDVLLGSPGCRSARMTRGVENPDRFVLLVEWDTLEDHTERFRGGERYTQWRALIGPHFETAEVQHAVDLS
jgi:heme-degrading monooxygenase HmoA